MDCTSKFHCHRLTVHDYSSVIRRKFRYITVQVRLTRRILPTSALYEVLFILCSATRSPNMAANVGLSTPRGSGTSGYVQRNLSHMKPRDNYAPYPKDTDQLRHRQRKPDKEILDHDRLREIEVKVFDLRDKLEDEEYVFPLYVLWEQQ